MDKLSYRQNVVFGIFAAIISIFIIRLYFLQILSDSFAATADKNVIKPRVLEPARGIVYDRHGKIIVTNTPVFDVFVMPKQFRASDTLRFFKDMGTPYELVNEKLIHLEPIAKNQPYMLRKKIDYMDYANILEDGWKYDGLKEVVRTTREYKYKIGAQMLGYIHEVNKRDIEKSSGYYYQGDLIGASGIERYYEPFLRGKKGSKMILVDALGREVGSFSNGEYDIKPLKGLDLQVSIDAELQSLGEELMAGKLGSIVAIEPSSGEILSFVSAPSFDPSLLTGTTTGQNFRTLQRDSLLPLFNRPLMAMYPPGSIFKILNGIIGLAEGTLKPESMYGCAGGFLRNKGRPRCHIHPSPLTLDGAIMHSCNAFFAATYVDFLQNNKFKNIYASYDKWHDYMKQFGVGIKTNVDIPNEKSGLLPTHNFYDRWYKKGGWRAMTIVSNAIGQGEVLMTPLQMANITACIANKGWYIQPHFFKKVMNPGKIELDSIEIPIFKKNHVDFSTSAIPVDTIFQIVFNGMENVTVAGTGTLGRVEGIRVCGKTGTAQNPHGEDHSVFIAFAPRENPVIAIAVIVENAGWGGSWAAPIAGMMIEYYLKREVKNVDEKKRISNATFDYSRKSTQVVKKDTTKTN